MTLEQRIGHLERQNKRLMRSIVAIGFVFGLVAFAGGQRAVRDGTFETVRAENFKIVDSDNNLRGQFGMVEGNPVLFIRSTKDRGIAIKARSGNPEIELLGSKNSRVIIGANPNAAGLMCSFDKGNVIVMAQDDPIVSVTDKNGDLAWINP